MLETEPLERIMFNTELVLEYVHKNLAIDRIKGRTEIEQYQRGYEIMVGRTHDIVVHSHGGFCGVVLSVGKLTFRKKTVLSCVVTITINNQTFDYLIDESAM